MNNLNHLSNFTNQQNNHDEISYNLFISEINDASPALKQGFSMKFLTSPLMRRVKLKEVLYV